MLNENQKLAVEYKYGPCLTLAGPGSGKTTVLVERILKLIETGVNPGEILVITFTKDAACEMKNRFLKRAGAGANDVNFGTFHSVFYHILRDNRKYSDYEIIMGKRKLTLIKDCLEIMKAGFDNFELYRKLEKDISFFMNSGAFSHDMIMEERQFREFLDIYEKRKREMRVMDFDDILVHTVRLLSEDETSLKKWQDKFSFFLVDELQDINGVQFEALKLLTLNHPGGNTNIFGVGDDDQSIYGFRGASPGFMMDFPKVFPDTKIIELDTNYRSAREIIYCSKRLIDVNKNRYYKDYKANSQKEGMVRVMEFSDVKEEAGEILKMIKENPQKDTAILYRNRIQSGLISSMLRQENINIFSDEPVFEISESFIAKDILSYLRLLKGKGENEDIIRIMNKPQRDLGRGGIMGKKANLEKWRDYYPKSSSSYQKIDKIIKQLRLMEKFSPYSCVNFIKKGMGYDDYLKRLAAKKKTDSEEYLSISDNLLSLAGGFKNMADFIEELSRENNPAKSERQGENVCLYTFHGSKGLEFDRVFILDANEGITPSKNAGSKESLEEERRMFYVAMTRAKEELYICVPEKKGENTVSPSRFIGDLLEKNSYWNNSSS